MNEFAILCAVSLIFGFTQKLADAHHEHGLTLFPFAGIVSGVLFGISGGFLISHSPILQGAYLGLLIFWLLKKKIDCLYHYIAATLMAAGVAITWNSFTFPFYETSIIVIFLMFFDVLKHKYSDPKINNILRFRFYFAHALYAAVTLDIVGFAVPAAGLLGVQIANIVFKIPKHKVLLVADTIKRRGV